jgi:hypothetical protein
VTGNHCSTSQHALAALHDTIVPATVGKIPGGQALVGGTLAASIDFNNQLRHGIVPVFVFVLGIPETPGPAGPGTRPFAPDPPSGRT